MILQCHHRGNPPKKNIRSELNFFIAFGNNSNNTRGILEIPIRFDFYPRVTAYRDTIGGPVIVIVLPLGWYIHVVVPRLVHLLPLRILAEDGM